MQAGQEMWGDGVQGGGSGWGQAGIRGWDSGRQATWARGLGTEQLGWARVFLKEPENCYFRFWGPSGHDSTLSRQLEGLDRVAVSHKTSLWTLKFEFCVICMCHKVLTSFDFFSAIYQCESRS